MGVLRNLNNREHIQLRIENLVELLGSLDCTYSSRAENERGSSLYTVEHNVVQYPKKYMPHGRRVVQIRSQWGKKSEYQHRDLLYNE